MSAGNKRPFFIAFLLITLLASCTKRQHTHKTGDIGSMLNAEKQYLRNHASSINISKTVSMGKSYDTHADSVKAAIEVMNLIIEINPDRVAGNKASYTKTIEPIDEGQGQMTTYERKPGELNPVTKMFTRKMKGKDGNYTIWYDFHIEREEHNPLFNSKETYDLVFREGKLSSIESFYGEDNLASEQAVLKTKILITEK